METQGIEIRGLLSQFFKEDRSQRPEFGLGFAALRRRELVEFAKQAKFELDHTQPHEIMVRILEAALLAGKFDGMVTVQEDANAKEIRILKEQVQTLLDLNADKTAAPPEGPDISDPPFLPPDPKAADETDKAQKPDKDGWMPNLETPEGLEGLETLKSSPATGPGPKPEKLKPGEYKELQTRGKKLGIKVHFLSGPDLKKAVLEAENGVHVSPGD